jgi:hypothetical protein
VTRVLVAGSYPPVPGPASAATVAAVRREWDDGNEVTVVSPRPSAAHLHGRLQGTRAPWELERLRRRLHAPEIVLCLENGVPFAPSRSVRYQHRTAVLLACVLRHFQRVTLVISADFNVDADVMEPVLREVGEIVVRSDEDRRAISSRFMIPLESISVYWRPLDLPMRKAVSCTETCSSPTELIRLRAAVAREAAIPPGPTTPLGPPDWSRGEQPRRLVSLAARRLLGRHTDTVRRWLVRQRSRL